ncbi:MAG: hypothetical protein JWP89_3342 [Schlesneria sp.]|nr:hypothetical protein [Schlesneria sp.]
MQSLRSGALFFCFVVAVYGCGKSDSNSKTLTGSVTLGGKPVEKGSINFIPKDGKTVTVGSKIVNGQYSASIPFGDKRVEIRAPKVTGQRSAYEGDPNSPKIDIVTELIPGRYNSQSELSFTVDAKSDKGDFALELPKE